MTTGMNYAKVKGHPCAMGRTEDSALINSPKSGMVGSFQICHASQGDGGSSLVWPSGKSRLGEAFLLDLILPLIKPVLLNYQVFQACRKEKKN